MSKDQYTVFKIIGDAAESVDNAVKIVDDTPFNVPKDICFPDGIRASWTFLGASSACWRVSKDPG